MKNSFFSDLTTDERRTFWTCFGGYTLDSIATSTYALVAPILITVVGFSKPQVGALTTFGLIGNAVGGSIAGIVADRFGRKAVLSATVLIVTLFSAFAALSSTYPEFVSIRFLQGLGVGGEAAIGGVLISEATRSYLRGRAVTWVQTGYAAGYAIAAGLMPVFFHYLRPTLAWRALFLAGALPSLILLYIRRYVPESAAYLRTTTERRFGVEVPPFWTIFDRSHIRLTLLGLCLQTGVLGGGFALHAWLPTYLQLALHLKIASTSGYLAISILGLLIGPIAGGLLADRVGRRTTLVSLLLLETAAVILLLFLHVSLSAAFVLIFLQGALQGGIAACVLPTLTSLFRTEIRGTGVGFCIAAARGLGSISTWSVGLLAVNRPLGRAIGISMLTAFGLAVLAAMLLPDRSRQSRNLNGAIDIASAID